MSTFPYGEILPPQPSASGSPGQNTMCVSRNTLDRIAAFKSSVPQLTWDHGGRFSFHRGRIHIKVLHWDWQWWRVRILDEKEEPHDLGLAFTRRVLLFPSRYCAIDAAEVFSSGQHAKVAPVVWENRAGGWRFGLPTYSPKRRRLGAQCVSRQCSC